MAANKHPYLQARRENTREKNCARQHMPRGVYGLALRCCRRDRDR